MQAQRAPSRNWGEAIGKIAQSGVAAWKLSKEREEEKKRRAEQKRTEELFIGSLTGEGGGGLAAALAASPNIMSHPQAAQYLSLAQAMAPKPAPETFEAVQDPYGRGGVGQRSSTTGKISGYQGPLAAIPEPETFDTVQDPYGRGGVAQQSSATGKFSGYQGPVAEPAAPKADAPPPLKDRLSMVRDLSSDWQKTVKPMQVLLDQSDRMNIGLEMAQAGDMLAGSQAILISFNKLLDPTSVVRESEYARSATGQSALETLRGYADKLSKGGAGVTLKELESYKRFGEKVVERALESAVGPERERISRLVEYAGVNPELIFTGRFAPNAQPAPPQAPESAVQPQVAPPAAPPTPDVMPATVAAPGAVQAGLLPTPTPQAGEGALDPETKERVAMIPGLEDDQLERQAQTVAANPDQYSDAEKRALALEWERRFGGG